jgi:uncharacterized protein (DUF2342 family)
MSNVFAPTVPTGFTAPVRVAHRRATADELNALRADVAAALSAYTASRARGDRPAMAAATLAHMRANAILDGAITYGVPA